MSAVSQNTLSSALSLRLFQVGNVDLAVREDEVLAVVDWHEPARLPFAQETVLGVAAIQGRMLTVLDIAKLLDVETTAHESILALRGSEQLALAGNVQGTIVIEPSDVEPATKFGTLSSGTIQRDGSIIYLLATDQLFATALDERRRKRI